MNGFIEALIALKLIDVLFLFWGISIDMDAVSQCLHFQCLNG